MAVAGAARTSQTVAAAAAAASACGLVELERNPTCHFAGALDKRGDTRIRVYQ